MTTLSPNLAAILDRLTDPRQEALADAREAFTELDSLICSLTPEKGHETPDWLDELQDHALTVERALDRLSDALQETRP